MRATTLMDSLSETGEMARRVEETLAQIRPAAYLAAQQLQETLRSTQLIATSASQQLNKTLRLASLSSRSQVEELALQSQLFCRSARSLVERQDESVRVATLSSRLQMEVFPPLGRPIEICSSLEAQSAVWRTSLPDPLQPVVSASPPRTTEIESDVVCLFCGDRMIATATVYFTAVGERRAKVVVAPCLRCSRDIFEYTDYEGSWYELLQLLDRPRQTPYPAINGGGESTEPPRGRGILTIVKRVPPANDEGPEG